MCFLLVTSGLQAALAATLQPDQLKQLIALSSDALISSGDQNWDEAKKAVADMKTLWDQNADETSVEATALGTAISDAQHALSEVAANPQAAPSHIIIPAIHKNRVQIAELLSKDAAA